MKKILVCDDDVIMLKVIDFLFKNDAIEVIPLTNGKNVVDIAKKHLPTIILLDLILPGKNGLTVLKELKGDNKVMEIPVIMMSAVEKKREIEHAFRMGIVDYIVKPFNSNELHEKVFKYL